jgi:hypothetical protein
MHMVNSYLKLNHSSVAPIHDVYRCDKDIMVWLHKQKHLLLLFAALFVGKNAF